MAPRPNFAALGVGGSEDRLSFRVIVRLLLRCVHLMRPVRYETGAYRRFVELQTRGAA